MRLMLRVLGTWLIGVALVLLIIDGTKSLGANALVLTSLAQLWTQLHPASLEGVQAFLGSRYFAALLDATFAALLGYPAFAVVGVPGVLLALVGRKRRRERFVQSEQI